MQQIRFSFRNETISVHKAPSSNINIPHRPPPFPWIMHSVPSLSRLAHFLLYFDHLLVMTKLWLDLRMCSAFICLAHCLILPPLTPLEPQPRPPRHTTHNGHLPRLTHLLLKSRVAAWFPWKHYACMCVFSPNVSPAPRSSLTCMHTKRRVITVSLLSDYSVLSVFLLSRDGRIIIT